MAFIAEELTAGLNPQKSVLSRRRLTKTRPKAIPKKIKSEWRARTGVGTARKKELVRKLCLTSLLQTAKQQRKNPLDLLIELLVGNDPGKVLDLVTRTRESARNFSPDPPPRTAMADGRPSPSRPECIVRWSSYLCMPRRPRRAMPGQLSNHEQPILNLQAHRARAHAHIRWLLFTLASIDRTGQGAEELRRNL